MYNINDTGRKAAKSTFLILTLRTAGGNIHICDRARYLSSYISTTHSNKTELLKIDWPIMMTTILVFEWIL